MTKTEVKPYSRFMGRQMWPKIFRPRLNYRKDWAMRMPKWIDPDNWTKITPEELKAHNERMEIRGRLRREYWTKAYHPVHGKHFNPITSDPMWTRFSRARSVYHAYENMNMTGKMALKSALFTLGIPIVYMAVVYYRHRNNQYLEPCLKNTD